MLVTCLALYALACVELKRASVELAVKSYFPLVIMGLILAQVKETRRACPKRR